MAYRYKIVRLFVGFSVLLGFVTFNFDRRTRCTNSWSNLTFKCNTDVFVKVDA